MKRVFAVLTVLCVMIVPAYSGEPIVLESQGSFMVGGTTAANHGEFVFSELWSPSGQTAYGDHA